MSHVLTVPDEIAEAAMMVSQGSGKSVEEVLMSALRAHFPPISAALQREFEMWEGASDEDEAILERAFGEKENATG